MYHSHKSYIRLNKNIDVDIQKIGPGKFKKGIYHDNIEFISDRLKKWMDGLNWCCNKIFS